MSSSTSESALLRDGTKEVILQYIGETSIHKKLNNADGSEKSESSSLICSFRSPLVNLKLDVVVVNSVDDFLGGYKRKIGQLKLSGVMSLVEGK